MKKVLYYFAQVLLLLSSVLLGFVGSVQTLILCLSCLVTGLLLMISFCVSVPESRPGFCLYGTAVFCHLFYLSASSSWSAWSMAGLCAFFIFAIWQLVRMVQYGFDPALILSFVLFEKTALLPEILLNRLMARSSGNEMFQTFSWVLLALTSAYALACIVRMIQKGMLSSAWGTALGLLQFCFVTDILSCAALLILAWRWKEPQEEPKRPLYRKASFSPNKKMKLRH